jgi:hypothetical protein
MSANGFLRHEAAADAFLFFGGELLARGQSERFLPEKSLSAYPKETQTQARSKHNGQSEFLRSKHNGEPIDLPDSKWPASSF